MASAFQADSASAWRSRALLKRPRALIFDEATGNLDPETAEQLARTVNQLKGHVTMIFIAHQLPRGLQVDEIVGLGGRPALRSVGVEAPGASVAAAPGAAP